MRKLVIAITSFVVLIVVAGLIFAATFDVNRYHGIIQSQLQKRMGRSVTIGDMHLGIFPPRFRADNLTIDDDPRFSPDAPFVKAQQIDVMVKLLPLFHKQIEIDSLALQEPSVNLIKNEARVWNFASLGHPVTAQSPQPTNAEQPKGVGNQGAEKPASKSQSDLPGEKQDGAPQFSIGELTVKDGHISVLDQTVSKTPTQYDHVDISLKNFSPGQSFTIDAAARMAGSGSHEARLQGEGGPVEGDSLANTPFHGTLKLKQVGLADLARFLNSPILNGSDGTLSGETKISNEGSKFTAQGEANIQNAKIKGMELGYPILAQYDLTNDGQARLTAIHKLALKLGATPLNMSGTISTAETPARVDLKLNANNVSVAEAAKLAAASGAAFSTGTTVTGMMNANIQVQGAANKPAWNGTITASNLQMSGRDIALPIQIHSVNLNLTPTEIRSNPFVVVCGGTALNTDFTVQNYLSPTAVVDATVRAPNAQLPAVLSIAKAYGVTALDKVSGQGTLSLDMRATGPIQALNTSEIIKALNGSMNVNFSDVKYAGANVNRELALIAGFLNPNPNGLSSEGFTNVRKMTGHVLVKNGIAETNDLQGQLDIGNVGITGKANLSSEAFNLRVTSVLSKASSQQVGGQNIGGFMKTALANDQGELVIPALVTGTFSSPHFQPDLEQLAQMKLKGLVPNLNNPATVAQLLQNALGGPKEPAPEKQQTQPQQQQQQNPIQQILDIFGQKKPQNEQPPKP